MDNNDANKILPKKRIFSIVDFISKSNYYKILFYGMLIYILPVILFTILEKLFSLFGFAIVHNSEGIAANFLEILYFNFITIITIGYGDFHPHSIGCIFSVLEGIMGVGIFSLLVAVLTTKFLSPNQNSIVFSRYGYYSIDDQRFMLIFVNTTKSNILSVEMTSYFKLKGDWCVKPSIKTPFITKSVQTFFLDRHLINDIIGKLKDKDVFRFGIAGIIGVSNYSTAVEYKANEIIVIQNRNELINYEEFHTPDFKNKDISLMFHYKPQNSLTLSEYVYQERLKKT